MTGVGAVFAILASAVIVLGGLVALTRALLRAAFDLRDNRKATVDNTTAINELKTVMDGRITSLEARMTAAEARLQTP